MKSIRAENGNVILEATAFVSVAFGLLLVSGIQLFTIQRNQLELESIARNTMRSYLNYPQRDMSQVLDFWQARSSILNSETIELSVSCKPSCRSNGAVVLAKLSWDGLSAEAFGVLSV